MAFKDRLKELIIEKMGVVSKEILAVVAGRAQTIAPDITTRYLGMLLHGHPPRDVDLQALTTALRVRPWGFLEGKDREIAEFAAQYFKRPEQVEKFRIYVNTQPNFRNLLLKQNELLFMMNEFIQMRKLQDELELFGLDIKYD